jgi:glycosyltransferase involved in cell wall biosynthesis
MAKWEAAIGPIVDHLQPDLIHCHDIFHLGLAVRAKARAKTAGRVMRVVYDAQEFIPGLPSDPWRRAAYTSLEEEYIGGADAVITVSESLGDLLFDRYAIRPGIVMNAPERSDPVPATPLREVIGLSPEDQLLVFVGGLAPDRGAEVLLAALPPLPESVHLVFVTNAVGGYREILESEAHRLGIGNRVHFAPFVEPEAVTSYIASADASIIPLSRDVINYEVALPNKLFQSIQAGVPVVVSDNPEMARFVPAHGVGTVFAGEDAASLTAGILQVLENRETYLANLADEEMLDALSWERQSEVLIGTYDSVGVRAT